MKDNSENRNGSKIKTGYYVFGGLVIGAVFGLVSYVKGWL